MRLTVIISCLVAYAAAGMSPSTNLADIYAQYGFDPAGTNSGLVIQINDVHFHGDTNSPFHTTDFDPVLVEMIREVNPNALFINGDLISSASKTVGNTGDRILAVWELNLAKARIEEHFGAVPRICITPGNHDSELEDAEGAALFNSVYPGVSAHTNITIGGVPILGLPGHNSGFHDRVTREWFARQREVISPTQQVLLMAHIPCLPVPPAEAREQGTEIYRWIKGWQAPVFVGVGHSHFRDYRRFRNGDTFVTKVETQTCNRKMSKQVGTPAWPGEAGFTTYVLENGEVKGWFMGLLTNRTYYPYRPSDISIQPDVLAEPYELVDGLMVRLDEGYYDRGLLSVSSGNGAYHTGYSWFFNPGPQVPAWVQAKIPAVAGATRLFLLAAPGQSQLHFYLGQSETELVKYVPTVAQPGNVLQLALPEALQGTEFWLKVAATSMASIGGFGLGVDDSRCLTELQKQVGKDPSQWLPALNLSQTNSLLPEGITATGYRPGLPCTSVTNVFVQASVLSLDPNTLNRFPNLRGVYFHGHAPRVPPGQSLGSTATVYYLPGTAGWSTNYAGRPTALWFQANPAILSSQPDFSSGTNGFSFVISWATNASVVVEVCSDPLHPVWLPISTNELSQGVAYFSDPDYTNSTSRLYRLRWP